MINAIYQIVARTYSGVNLLWDNEKKDFVSFRNEVESTDIIDWQQAKLKADTYDGIEDVFQEYLDLNTQKSEVIDYYCPSTI
jgi:hypothetical protein